ncbi:MAG TPA: amylo-alpha-1,6-glucosidase, partial [Tepidisphaeraceae bacterium]
LCAATLPPVGRIMALNRIGEIITFDNNPDAIHEFSSNQFGDNFHPRGEQYLESFEINDVARWQYLIEGVRITKEVQLLWLQNTVAIRYTIDPPQPRPIELQLLPFVSLRDFHSLRRSQDAQFQVACEGRSLSVSQNQLALHVIADQGAFREQHNWWYGHTYATDAERGLEASEDLFSPARLIVSCTEKTIVTLYASMQPIELPDWDHQIERRTKAIAAATTAPENVIPTGEVVATIKPPQSPTLQKLFRAANDFIVFRKTPEGKPGTSIIAGYPWFADWGRDTMISLPGLLLVTGRFQQAREVLTVFAQYVSEGMIPNRFDDYNNEPHYNTVDASLWFIHAAYEYLRLSHDGHTFEDQLLPASQAIFKGYSRGTRFGIKLDEADGLITQGDANTQLTWMDAKTEGIAFTPRQGKAVEINALWYNALRLLEHNDLADKVAESFRKMFWISPFRGLADVVNGDNRDAKIRPNQIFAVSLPHSPLKEDQRFAVVEVVRRELLTPVGLRTLSPSDPGYHARYTGPQRQRDEAYHNGTIWAWPLGAFLEAYLKVHRRSAESVTQAKQWLQPLLDRMETDCIGQLHEIYEAEPPHRPVGCPAQAWSIAEALRLANELGM